MVEPTERETRLRRLHMRSIRRGIKEMDIVLSRFAADDLPGLDDQCLDIYEEMLSENDHDLYRWVSGQEAPPARYSGLIEGCRAAMARALEAN